MKKSFKILVPLIVLFSGIYIFSFTANSVSVRGNSAVVKAAGSKITAGGLKDIAISLERVLGIFYINKGLAKGISVGDLNTKILSKQVTLFYAKPTAISKFSPMTSTNRITELRVGDKVIYTER